MIKYFYGLLIVIAIAGCKKKKDDDDSPKIDNIRVALSPSIAAYDNATINTWVKVTAAEYNNLLITVTGSAKYGSLEAFMNTSANGAWNGNLTIGGAVNSFKVPILPQITMIPSDERVISMFRPE